MTIHKENLSPEQLRRSRSDLQIIDRLTKVAPNWGIRVIISGGYAVDGFLGEITRPHNDVDVQIYGTNDNPEETIERLLDSIAPSVFEYTTEDKGRKEYYHNLLYHLGESVLDIYYLQTTTSPLGKEKHIVKSDGTVDEQEFAEPIYGHLEGVTFEIQHPETELKDKIYKREVRGDPKRIEHEQDIENLKQKI